MFLYANLSKRKTNNKVSYSNCLSRSIRVVGEMKNVEEIKNIVVSTASGAQVKLKDIARVADAFHEPESFARYNGKNVITLNVIKKSGQNLLDAADQIKSIIEDLRQLP